jgi:hypothetical protein
MEQKIQIQFHGVQESWIDKLQSVIISLIYGLVRLTPPLDFRRMYRIIVTENFSETLNDLSELKQTGNKISYTNEEYAVAVAKIVLLPVADGIEIVPVFASQYLSALISEDINSDNFRYTLHLMHHEFCHVHDENKKIDALRDVILKQSYKGKESFLFPLAESCWAEYIANFMSANTAMDSNIFDTTNSLNEAILRTKNRITEKIDHYRYNADLQHLLEVFERDGKFLIKAAAYTLGYLDGLNTNLETINKTTATTLNGSYFEKIWKRLHIVLTEMRERYQEDWNGIQFYQELADIVDEYYKTMGFVLSTVEDDQTYVSIP